MTIKEKIIHTLILSLMFSIISWLVVDNLIIDISFLKYFLIEIILIISLKFYKFTIQKFKLN
jgi:hypothetical protein